MLLWPCAGHAGAAVQAFRPDRSLSHKLGQKADAEIAFAYGLAADGALVFAVEDTGIGIAPEDIERVTEPFIQAESHLSRRYEGVGLGLALTKQFAQLHGASLSIESSKGKGTRVEVRFPASRMQPVTELRLAASD